MKTLKRKAGIYGAFVGHLLITFSFAYVLAILFDQYDDLLAIYALNLAGLALFKILERQ